MAFKGWNLSPKDRFEMDIYLKALEGTEEMKEKVVKEIERQAIEDKDILRLMQIPGISLLSGFIIKAEIGADLRFTNPGKLPSYGGLIFLNSSIKPKELHREDNKGRKETFEMGIDPMYKCKCKIWGRL